MSTECAQKGRGLIGPNALIRLGEAVRNRQGEIAERDLFRRAALEPYLEAPPETMVPEAEVMALHRALYETLPREEAERLLATSGVLTARYLLTNRIPPWAQRLICVLPKWLGGRLLLGAIRKNSWTFAGTAEVRVEQGDPAALVMRNCQLCAGLDADARPCRYHEATIETLFRSLVSPCAAAKMKAFSSRRGGACAVEIHW